MDIRGRDFGFVSLYAFCLAATSSQYVKKFNSDAAVRGTAVIDSMRFHQEHGGSYLITYHFIDSTKRYHSIDLLISKESGDGLQSGGSMPVKYLKDDPMICRVDLPYEANRISEPLLSKILLGCVAGVVSLFSFVSAKSATR